MTQLTEQTVGIKRETLTKALQYLACPFDKGDLHLPEEIDELVINSSFECSICKRVYPIKNGVPYFYETSNGYEWDKSVSFESIVSEIIATLDDQKESLRKISSLGSLFLSRFDNDRKRAIDEIFRIVEHVVSDNKTTNQIQAQLLQAATAARYDIEIYRGTFQLPESILSHLTDTAAQPLSAAIVEGACATGECLLNISKQIDSPFYIGIDISGSLIREAQKQATENMLFIQGDIAILPLKYNSSQLYVFNNVLDRVVDPYLACQEADRILHRTASSLVISNCHPLQFTYKTNSGNIITFVPEHKQLSIEDAMEHVGFSISKDFSGTGDAGWRITTAAFGDENLPFKSVTGSR